MDDSPTSTTTTTTTTTSTTTTAASIVPQGDKIVADVHILIPSPHNVYLAALFPVHVPSDDGEMGRNFLIVE